MRQKTNKSVDTSKDDGKQVYISISDSGKGISSLILPRLFQKFFTDSNYGTGLGLYIYKKLVEAQDGKIWAFNNNSGIGSTFVFSLPKVNHEAIVDKEQPFDIIIDIVSLYHIKRLYRLHIEVVDLVKNEYYISRGFTTRIKSNSSEILEKYQQLWVTKNN